MSNFIFSIRNALLVILVCFINTTSYCQNKDSINRQDFIKKTITAAAQYATLKNEFNNAAPPAIRMPANSLLKKTEANPFLKPKADKKNSVLSKTKEGYSSKVLDGLCKDTSYSRLLGVQNAWLYIQSVTKTMDGGMLVPAFMYDSALAPNQFSTVFGLLIKLDGDGNLLWVKQFEHDTTANYRELYMTRVFELSNHDIICAGLLNTNTMTDVYKTILYRLTSEGQIIWQNSLQSNIDLFNNGPGSYTLRIESAADGINGDVILCGTSNANVSFAKLETVVRLNSQGQLIWDANFGNQGDDGSYLLGAEGTMAFVQNGQIVLVGLSHGTGYPQIAPAVNFLTLDYNNGNELTRRFFRPEYKDDLEEFYKSFTYYANKCTRLTNGHVLFYGKLFSDFVNMTDEKDHFGVIEFDAAFNLVNAYTISSGLTTNYSNNILHFDASGKGIVSVLQYVDSYEANVFFGAFADHQFQNQRKAYYPNAGMPGNNGFAFLNDNGYAYVQTYFQNLPETKSYVEFRKMHNSDTSSQCLGKDTLLLNFLPLHIIEDPKYWLLDSNKANLIQSLELKIKVTDTLSSSSINPCKQINYCDTVKIHGNPVICGGSGTALFTVFKNIACGAISQWNIDTAAIDSLKVLTDTSVRIWFKNINWQGKLNASLPAGACYLPAIDSLNIKLVRLQSQLTLGPDTTLCNQNTLLLHAGNSFSNYVWQDGSTDSTFTVRIPGKYYVTAGDACGNIFSDTVSITPANYPFTIGTDTLRCNNDTLHLIATPGFNNYHWFSNYKISSDTGQTINAYPAVDTLYYATAEKRLGCIVRDSIHISVYNSPPVYLGADTSLCTGQSLILDAGAGFINYLWNNGSNLPQLKVNLAGTYLVKAVAANTCASYDTLIILNVSPLPVFSLGADTTICNGTVYQYTFSLPNATYIWQDGNTGNQYSINSGGQYNLAVTQAGCTTKDTVVIAYKESSTVYLGKDTSLCSGDTFLLNAAYPNASYTWQDGSAQPQLTVIQPGAYSVRVNLNGCYASDTVNVDYIPKPVFTLGKDTTLCNGQSFLLQPAINTNVNYTWQNGSNLAVFNITSPGFFTLTASNNCGAYTDDIKVTEGLCKLIMPNSFTPNGDGLNDLFRVKYPFTVKDFQFLIYNRFGEKIFETTDMHKGWDGTYKSVKQGTGSYIWVIKIKGLDDVAETSSGTVTIIL